MVVANWPIRARDLLLLCYKEMLQINSQVFFFLHAAVAILPYVPQHDKKQRLGAVITSFSEYNEGHLHTGYCKRQVSAL